MTFLSFCLFLFVFIFFLPLRLLTRPAFSCRHDWRYDSPTASADVSTIFPPQAIRRQKEIGECRVFFFFWAPVLSRRCRTVKQDSGCFHKTAAAAAAAQGGCISLSQATDCRSDPQDTKYSRRWTKMNIFYILWHNSLHFTEQSHCT